MTRLNGIYGRNLDGSGVTKLEGLASFVGPKEVKVGDKTYTGTTVLIAVGGTPDMPAIPVHERRESWIEPCSMIPPTNLALSQPQHPADGVALSRTYRSIAHCVW